MEPSKEKTPPGGHRPPGDTALNCPTQSEHPLREHGRSAYQTPEPPAPCRTPHSSGKPLHLTSASSRAFLLYLRHGLRKPNAAGVWGVGHGAQNSLLAIAHRILTAATPFCSLLPPLAALANVPASLSAPPVLVAAIPFGDAPRADFHPSLAPAAAIAPLCAGWPGWLMRLSATTRRARRLGVPSPVPRRALTRPIPPPELPSFPQLRPPQGETP